ncbi:hypothetical protein ACROYT_G001621 [Oculina patagonica]
MAGESVDTFIQELYRLAEDCEYGSLKDGLIRDRIVVGVLDDSLSDRLQAKADLTLETAVQMSRQAEARRPNKDLIRGNVISETATDPTREDLVEKHKRDSKPDPGVGSKPERKCMWKTSKDYQKCEFSQGRRLTFLGHIVDAQGVHADPEKTNAIGQFLTPKNVTELQRFMGMANQPGKFVPGLDDINAPLRQLLRKDSAWYWGEAQQTALQQVKEKLASPEVLAHYDPNRATVIAADASSAGLGAVLLQIQDNGQRRPIFYISRSLSDAEKNYAVIEKEALASTWACERLEEYVPGLPWKQITSRLFHSSQQLTCPILRFRLRMMRYNPEVLHVPGKCQISADALSREEVEIFASSTVNQLPANAQRLQEIIESQRNDEVCMQVRRWVEIKRLTTQTAKCVIAASKELLATHFIPDIVISNNGPCFSAVSFQDFALPDILEPTERLKGLSNQRKSFNQRHRAKELPAVTAGDSVWIRDQNRLGKIQGRTQHPRSFLIETEKGTIRRNRSALIKAYLQSPSNADKQATSTGTASYHAFQETEEKTGPSQLPGTIAEAPMQPARSQTAPLPSQLADTLTEAPMQPVCSQTAPLQTHSGRIVKPPDRLDL